MPPVIDSHQHFWDLSRFDYPWMHGAGAGAAAARLPARRPRTDSSARPGWTGRSSSRRSTTSRRADGCWASSSGTTSWPASWAGSTSPARRARTSSPSCGATPRSSACGTSPTTSPTTTGSCARCPAGPPGPRAPRCPLRPALPPRHLRHVPTLAGKLPDLPMVIDHLAKPLIKEGRMDGWREDFEAAARHPNVYCKLSGMVTEADWDAWAPSDFAPYVRVALEAFGPGASCSAPTGRSPRCVPRTSTSSRACASLWDRSAPTNGPRSSAAPPSASMG